MNYFLSPEAVDDIIHIFEEGILNFGLNQAINYHEQLEKTILFLSRNPKAARERFEITPPVRIHPIGSHIVIYSISEEDDIYIIRVRHGHEDWIND